MDPSTERNLLQRLRDSLFSVPSLSLRVELSRTSLCAGPPPAASLLPVAAPVRLLTSSTPSGGSAGEAANKLDPRRTTST
jgi:hypothetical protein